MAQYITFYQHIKSFFIDIIYYFNDLEMIHNWRYKYVCYFFFFWFFASYRERVEKYFSLAKKTYFCIIWTYIFIIFLNLFHFLVLNELLSYTQKYLCWLTSFWYWPNNNNKIQKMKNKKKKLYLSSVFHIIIDHQTTFYTITIN